MNNNERMKEATKALRKIGGDLCVYKDGKDYVGIVNDIEVIRSTSLESICEELTRTARDLKNNSIIPIIVIL